MLFETSPTAPMVVGLAGLSSLVAAAGLPVVKRLFAEWCTQCGEAPDGASAADADDDVGVVGRIVVCIR